MFSGDLPLLVNKDDLFNIYLRSKSLIATSNISRVSRLLPQSTENQNICDLWKTFPHKSVTPGLTFCSASTAEPLQMFPYFGFSTVERFEYYKLIASSPNIVKNSLE